MRPRFTGLWRRPDFLTLWVGYTVSVFGSQITLLALPLTAVLVLHATPFQMGLLAAAGTAPFLVLSLFAGVWVDRRRRRPLMIAADLGRAVLLLSVPLAAALHALHMEQLYAVALTTGALTVLYSVSSNSFIPQLVGRENLVAGNARLRGSFSASQAGGPALAGGLIQLVTAPFAMLGDAASFLFSALMLGRLRTVEPPRPQPERRHVLGEIGQGLRLVLREPLLRASTACTGTFNFFNLVLNAELVLFATRTLDLGPGVLGLVFAVASVGSLLGATLAGPVTRRLGHGPTIIYAIAIVAAALLLVPAARGPRPLAIAILGAGEFIAGLAVTIFDINLVSLWQAATPDHVRGRVSATNSFISQGTRPLGSLLGGVLAVAIGLRATLLFGAAGSLLAVLWVWFSPLRSLRRLPGEVEEAAPAEAPEPLSRRHATA